MSNPRDVEVFLKSIDGKLTHYHRRIVSNELRRLFNKYNLEIVFISRHSD